MSTSRLDAMYRSILLTKFFTKGWGKPENLRRLFEFRKVVSNREECFKLIDRDYPVTITKEQKLSDCRVFEGYFTTPLEKYLPGIVPPVALKAHFQILLPNRWPQEGCKPMCLHLAGTGDHFFWRRRNLMVKPLLKEAGIGGIILENPFYGLRKPIDQVRSSLHNVSDIFVMGGCLILESLVLFHWCERNGLGPIGVTGLSMGGHMASLAATNWPKPLVLVPCLSWSTASAVFLEGVMSQSINWDLLEDQYLSDGVYREKLSKMVTIVDEAFLAGKKFAQTYAQTVTSTDTQTDKHVDLLSKENIKPKIEIVTNEKHGIVDVSQNILDSDKSRKNISHHGAIDQIENLNDDLRMLLNEKKISEALFHKLTSNKRFQLEPDDIEVINKLNRVKLKEFLLKCKVAELKHEQPLLPQDPSNFTPSGDAKSSTKIPPKISGVTPSSNTTLEITTVDCASFFDTSKLSKPKPPTMNLTIPNPPLPNSPTPKLPAPNQDTVIVKSEVTVKEIQVKPASKITSRKSWNVSDLTSDFWINLPWMRSGRKIDISKIHWRDREALQFMRGIMDECTHLSNFSVPYDTSLIIAVCAKHDAYVPRADVGALEEIWPGAEVRYVDAGHVSAYILHQSLFRACIREAFERSKKKWKDGKHLA